VKLLLFSFFIGFFCNGFAQGNDTVFYSNKAVLMITTEVNNSDSVIAMYDQNGKSILTNNPIFHSFFDTKFGKKRFIKVEKRKFMEDYCVSESDTIYNYFPHDEHFENRLQSFYKYLEQNVIYPKNALKKGIQANIKISIIIDANGSITNVFPLTKHEWGFEETLIRTIKEKKQFGFVMYQNKPIKHYIEIPFAFKIVAR
jgi:hypothetical protein